MKILHTADWHLGKRLDYFSRLEEQKAVLEEICEIADREAVDAVLVAGDLFDTFNPQVEAVELLYRTLRRLTNYGTRPVIAIAGNHDSADRIDSPDTLARECGILFVGYPNAHLNPLHLDNSFSILKTAPGFLEITFPHLDYPLRVFVTPYANELRLKQYLGLEDKAKALNEALANNWQELAEKFADNKGVNMLLTHLYMLKRGGEILEEPEGEKPLNIGHADLIYSDFIPSQIQYTALGHLHRLQNVGSKERPALYSGSPLAYSFAEAGQEKYVVIIDANPNRDVEFTKMPLVSGRPLHRKRFTDLDEAITWLQHNPEALVELTIVSDSFLSSKDIKRIHEAHDGIIHIIPVVTKQESAQKSHQAVNLEQDVTQLFQDYFKHRLGQEPNEEIMDLFKEIVHSTSESEEQ